MTRRALAPAVALAILLAACGGVEPLTDDEALWCRVFVPPFLIQAEAQEMGIDIEIAMTDAQIAYDLEGIIGADPVAQMLAFYEAIEPDEGYLDVCRSVFARRP